MNISLYNIQNEYLQIVNTLIENGGEVTEEIENEIQISKDQLQTKGVCYGFIYKQLEAENTVIDNEIERLTKMKASRSNSMNRLKTNLATAMQVFEVEKLETPLIKICFQNSKSVGIEDLALLDNKYKKTSIPVVSADKVAIKKALEAGETVVGAVLNTNKNIQIK